MPKTPEFSAASTFSPPCREVLRGRESRCNGGGYDGCACGPFSKADLRVIEDARKARLREMNIKRYGKPDAFPPRLTGTTQGRPGSDETRVPINIDAGVREELRALLYEPWMRGVGYSEFIQRAIIAARAENDVTQLSITELRELQRAILARAEGEV